VVEERAAVIDERSAGTLIVVATPIGNLGDLPPRAAEALRSADLVVAEDTRRTGKLLGHVGADTPQLSYHEHNERDRALELVARIRAGEQIVLVSDAGTPGVSDPGYRLVDACVQAGLRVEAVPGASAPLYALVVSGLPTDRFTFEGFLPRKGTARRRRLDELAREPRTMVLFVSPHRVAADLRDLADACGRSRRAALGRELTKLHEEVLRAPLGDLAGRAAEGFRGELTLVVEGAPDDADTVPPEADELVGRVRGLVATGLTKKQAIADVAAATGMPKRDVYQAVVEAGS
jgi:16S rRNA (cytidine1402-2'-O)-methyltransferase